MQKTFKEFTSDAILNIGNEILLEPYKTSKQTGFFTFIRTKSKPLSIIIDGVPHTIKPHRLLALTNLQYLQFVSGTDILVYQFNQAFYCVKDHDQEVSCVGLLFFGNINVPLICLQKKNVKKLNLLHEIFIDELETKDNIQAEMLRMLMARFIIIGTRLLKANTDYLETRKGIKIDVLRSFNVLVELHFKTEHSVTFYANKLFKSPKTLSNSFAKFKTSPLQIIHERIVLEAKRLLMYSDKTAKAIAYELGFDDASHLSRLFKKHTLLSPSDFKKQLQNGHLGKN